MKQYVHILVILLATALCAGCGTKNEAGSNAALVADTAQKVSTDTVLFPPEDTSGIDSEYETMYMVVIDTGVNYYTLANKMIALHNSLQLKIDTLGRYYNSGKNDVVLPDDAEDELYAGDYFPRRWGTGFLSIEHLSFYRRNTDYDTVTVFVLTEGLYDNRQSADSMAVVIKPYQPTTFVMEVEVFMGCMH